MNLDLDNDSGKNKKFSKSKEAIDGEIQKYVKDAYLDGLITRKQDPSLDRMKRKAKSKEETRIYDKYYYQFDNFHKEHCIHLHKYRNERKILILSTKLPHEMDALLVQ